MAFDAATAVISITYTAGWVLLMLLVLMMLIVLLILILLVGFTDVASTINTNTAAYTNTDATSTNSVICRFC